MLGLSESDSELAMVTRQVTFIHSFINGLQQGA